MRRYKAIWLATSAFALTAHVAAAQTTSAPAATADPTAAKASAATAGAADGSVSAVVVTGIRASSERAVKIKANADQLIDTVSATEIGALPDFNAGDALKRVTGVDAILYQGEPRYVTVRGFNENYNDLLIDGFTFASTDINMGETTTGGRQVDMEMLPSNIASHIDVIKTATAANDGNWIGGLTNFVTPSAFDFKDDSFSVSALGGATLQSGGNGGDKPDVQAEVAFAKRFGSSGEFGLYVSATYWRRDINVAQEEAGSGQYSYTAAGAPTTVYGGNGYAVPQQRLYYNYQNERDRLGLQGRLDWRPSSRLNGYVNAYTFHQDERSNRNDLAAVDATTAQDLNQTANSGQITNASQYAQLGRYRWHRDMYGLYGRLNAELGAGWNMDLGSSWSMANVNNPQVAEKFTQTGLAYNYTFNSAGLPVYTPVNAATANNLANYKDTQREVQDYRLNENRFDEQLNIGHNMGANDRGLGVQAGTRVTAIFHAVSLTDTVYTGMNYTLADVASGKTLCGFDCSTPIPVINSSQLDKAFQASLATDTATPNLANETGGTYNAHEVVTAGYVEANYRTDRWLLTAGLRVEGTYAGSQTSEGTTQSVSVNGKATSLTTYAPVSANHDYYNLLPSALFVYNTSDSSKLRLGVSQTVSRPTFAQESLAGGVLNLTSTTPTLTTGNPDLKPRTAENFDIGHDWYIDHGRGIFTVAAFYKLIHNDIFNYGVTQTVNGTAGVLVTEAENTSHLVHDAGIELGYSQALTFLPGAFSGLGVSANATFSRAHFPVTLSDGTTRTFHNLPDQPAQIFNTSVYYDKGRWHGRFAWNHLSKLWDDRYPYLTAATFYENRFQQPTNNFDVQASYDVTPRFSINVDALNITQQGIQLNYGVHQELTQGAWKLPAEVMIGFKFKS